MGVGTDCDCGPPHGEAIPASLHPFFPYSVFIPKEYCIHENEVIAQDSLKERIIQIAA